MERPLASTNTTPEITPEIPQPAASIALSGVERVLLNARINLTERGINRLEKKIETLADKDSLVKASARSVLKIGRQDTHVAIGDSTDNPEGWVLGTMPTPKEPSREDYNEGDQGERDYQDALSAYQERLGKHTKHAAKISSIVSEVDGKAAANIGLTRDVIVERSPRSSEEGTDVVNSGGKVEIKSYKAMQPVTYRERRINRRHHKKRRQNFDKAVSAFTIKEAFGEHRIDSTNEGYDRKLKNERLTRSERKAIRRGRRFQGRNIRSYDRNRASLQKDAQGNEKDARRLMDERVKKGQKLVKLHDIKVRSSDTYKAILTQQAIDRANRELAGMPAEEIKKTLQKRYYARMIGEMPVAGEDESARKRRVEISIIEEAMANLSATEKDQITDALKV